MKPVAASVGATEKMDVGTASQRDLPGFIQVLGLSGLRSWASSATVFFIPKFYQDVGFSPSSFGLIAAVFMGGSAIGGVAGGMLADRWGKRQTILTTLLLGAIPFYFFPIAHGGMIHLFVLLAGLLNGASHPALLTMAQRKLPGRAGFAVGLTLGVNFGAGAVGAFFSGLAGDVLGLTLVLQANAALSLIAALSTLTLRSDQRARQGPAVLTEGRLPLSAGTDTGVVGTCQGHVPCSPHRESEP
jgi:predicted MFS family arabinose efflux permease